MTMKSRFSAEKINVLFLGGSNTMMKSGYSGETVKALSEYFELGRVDNLAIGGSAVGMGLYTSLGLKSPDAYDVIFLAYSISDYSFVKMRSRIGAWRWAFENLLLELRHSNPDARIYPLLFGRRGKHEDKFTQRVFQLTREI